MDSKIRFFRIQGSILALIISMFASCAYDPAFSVSCSAEGERDGNRECRDGNWVVLEPGLDTSMSDDGSIKSDGSDPCEQESDLELCIRVGLTCAEATVEDNCGTMRSVNCGSCTQPATCGGGGTPNVCACSMETDEDFCARYGASCDPFTNLDACGQMRTVNCGMCDGAQTCGEDNTCSCEPTTVCADQSAACGTLDVQGLCGTTMSVECGTCGDDNASCVANQCECDDGWERDGDTCVDIDECAVELDDCDRNADCMNIDGSFMCMCEPGYEGDGKTCTRISIVTSVQIVEVALPDRESSVSVTLPDVIDPARAVPFATRRLSNTDGEGDRLTMDVWISANDEVTVFRTDDRGPTTVVVYVVEFDDADVEVQSGTFSFDQETGSENLSNAVNQGDSFFVFYYTSDSNSDEKRDYMVAGDIGPGGMSVRFERDNNRGTIEGHWWVVSSKQAAFTVQHLEGEIADGDESDDIPISMGVTTDKSMLLYSHAATTSANDSDRGQPYCHLESSTNVECVRGSSSDEIPKIRAQVVTFAGMEFIQRGLEVFADGDERTDISLGTTVPDAMAFGGRIGLVGAAGHDTDSGMRNPGGFFTQELINQGADIRLQRGTPRNTEATVSWQVVDW